MVLSDLYMEVLPMVLSDLYMEVLRRKCPTGRKSLRQGVRCCYANNLGRGGREGVSDVDFSKARKGLQASI